MANLGVQGAGAVSSSLIPKEALAAAILATLAGGGAVNALATTGGKQLAVAATLAASSALSDRAGLAAQITAILAAQTLLAPFPMPVRIRRALGPNVFASPLYFPVANTSAFGIPPAAGSQATIGQPFILFIPIRQVPNSIIDSLLFTRPDGTQYSVGSTLFYTASEFAIFHIIYAVQEREFTQFGWWLVQYVVDGNRSVQFAFYVWPGQI